MSDKRVALYERLPEIYRLKDEELAETGQLPGPPLRHYLALIEEVLGALDADIETLYHDLFVETASDWVIPYLGDLLGVDPLPGPSGAQGNLPDWARPYPGSARGDTPLSALARTRRADLADTIALRRRKGTLAAVELLTHDITEWRVHAVELRDSLVWQQHLNHQRPDAGGEPTHRDATRPTQSRGGTLTLRDPATLSLLGTPFDPFAHLPDVRPIAAGAVRRTGYNLPNLAIFLWRLGVYRLRLTRPVFRGGGVNAPGGGDPRYAPAVARFDLNPRPNPTSDPMSEPLRLFNFLPAGVDRSHPRLVPLDRAPGPMIAARLSDDSPAGNPGAYLAIAAYDPAVQPPATAPDADLGLELHLPLAEFGGVRWHVRGGNLCDWENGLNPPLRWDLEGRRELVVDPRIGRLLFAVADAAERDALRARLLATLTYGAPGAVGAHPIGRDPLPAQWNGQLLEVREVRQDDPAAFSLQAALENLPANRPLAVRIRDSRTYDLDLGALATAPIEGGGPNLELPHSLILRADPYCRPIVRLAVPLRFRPADPAAAERIGVRLEGLYLTRAAGFPAGEALVARAAVHALELLGCTLDPGGYQRLDGTAAGDPAPYQPSLSLDELHGYAPGSAGARAFDQVPDVLLRNCIAGAVRLDPDHRLFLAHSILDAGAGVTAAHPGTLAIGDATGAGGGWAAATRFEGVTVFGSARLEHLAGQGGVWVHALRVKDNQSGCIKYSWFRGSDDRLPLTQSCVKGSGVADPAPLRFAGERFGTPAYAQLALDCDPRIRGQGPWGDQMGAYGFLGEAHKWRGLQLRYREQMPVGIRPLLIPLT